MAQSDCSHILTTFLISILFSSAKGYYYVSISNDGPIVLGGTITFQADLHTVDGSPPSGTFRFSWEDNAIQKHQWVEKTSNPRSAWNVTYPSDVYYPGEYEVAVSVDKLSLFYFPICSRREWFNVTALLNGRMNLVQNTGITSNFVSSAQPVCHEIALSEADSNYLRKNATEVSTYWFVDCVLYGQSEDFSFNYSYSAVGKEHDVEALVVASYEPLTTPAPITTSTTVPTTSSTMGPNSTVAPITTHAPSSPLPKVEGTEISSNDIEQHVKMLANASLKSTPYICLNSSIIPPDPKKTYGYFHRHVSVKAPVQNITVLGTNWLQQSDVLDLKIYCNGSSAFRTCSYVMGPDYNSTGKESCFQEDIIDNCQLHVQHFDRNCTNYTMLVIISNDVSKVVYPIRITIYEVQKNAQLSVIVVPVTCSMVAVILIVFGVAYYVQNRKRYTIEVADFDFGQVGGDMEYKTFRERLREAVVNSFNRDFGMDGDKNVWSPSRKYGSMQ